MLKVLCSACEKPRIKELFLPDFKTCKFCRIKEANSLKTCTKCHKSFGLDNFVSNLNGEPTLTCLNCRQKVIFWSKCEHERYKNKCKLCSPINSFVTDHRRRLCSFITDKRKRRPTYYDELLGCTIEHFRYHLESKFTTEMNFENYGSYWTIDHCIPLLEIQNGDYLPMDEIKDRMHYSNIRPLEKRENILKSNKPFYG